MLFPRLSLGAGGIYQFPNLCLDAWCYFRKEHTACLEGGLAIASDCCDLFGRRPHVFWEAICRVSHIIDAGDSRPVDEPC